VKVRCAPLPDWVDNQGHSVAASEPIDAYIDNGLCRILYDSQVNLAGAGFANHFRTMQRVVTRAGAERAAHFAVEFDPTHQSIDVHFIRVWRAHSKIDHASDASFQLLRRETKLERLALDGRLTATLLISDLRIDDVLDVSITIYSNNPILGGKYAGWFALNATAPWLEVRHRLLRPAERCVFERAFNEPPEAGITTSQGMVESTWTLSAQRRLEAEEFSPPWQIQVPAIQFSEFRSWDEVAQIFYPHYAASELPAELSTEVDRVARTYSDPADRAAEWLRFVQRELRYFALGLGEGGLVPRELDAIWKSRFGDCKDASRLFLAGARHLGIDACAALTSTTHGLALFELLPSPSAFNHCIVRLRLNAKTYWLDPTMPRQEGRLDVIHQPHAGWALPLTHDTTDLQRQQNDEPVFYQHSEQELRIGPMADSPASLLLRVDHQSFAADSLRHRIENEGHSKYSEQTFNELRAIWPDIVESLPLSLKDDRVENRLTATFSYEIRNGWKPVNKKGHLGFKISTGSSIATELNPLKKTQRRTEVYLGRPRKATWRARVHMPRRWTGSGWNQVLNAMNVRYSNDLVLETREICQKKEIVIANWSLPASQAAAYQELVAKARENLTTIAGRVTLGRIYSPGNWPFGLGGKLWAALVMAFSLGLLIWFAIRTAAEQH
jgi:transglutaminase-like putative cysteine protease